MEPAPKLAHTSRHLLTAISELRKCGCPTVEAQANWYKPATHQSGKLPCANLDAEIQQWLVVAFRAPKSGLAPHLLYARRQRAHAAFLAPGVAPLPLPLQYVAGAAAPA